MLSARVGQNFKWVGQSPEWVGHGLPGLGLEPPLIAGQNHLARSKNDNIKSHINSLFCQVTHISEAIVVLYLYTHSPVHASDADARHTADSRVRGLVVL